MNTINNLGNIFMTKSTKLMFNIEDYIVYPKHGVGRIVSVENQVFGGSSLELYVVKFEKEKMTLRVPTNKAETAGMRNLSDNAKMKEALETLKGKAKIKRTMWSRRAQEYEAKINSGDLVSIAEVVRDLHRTEDQPEQSYSERQIYETALGRLAREIAAVESTTESEAILKLQDKMYKEPPKVVEAVPEDLTEEIVEKDVKEAAA